jgi:cell division protein FtsW (lipid II flippase)
MRALLEKLGQNPQRSLAIFLRGLGLFVIGLMFIALGYYQHYWWQIMGLVVLAVACLTAAWGYIGLFANRWLNMLNRHQPKNKNIKF